MTARTLAASGCLAALLGIGCLPSKLTEAGLAVTVTPPSASVVAGGTLSFSATVTGTSAGQSTAVTWAVQETSGGAIDAAGNYAAPQAPGTYHVIASSLADPMRKDAATVNVTPAPAGVSVSISPASASVTTGGTATFTATVSGTTTGQSTTAEGSVQESGGGTIEGSGKYTAPATVGTYHVIATSVADTSKSMSATVTVTPAPVISVSISPASASLMTLGTATFTATVSGTTTGQSTAVTWSVQESGGGTIEGSGKYTAPATAGTYHVVATSVADTSKSKSATMTVTAPAPLSVTTSSLPDGTVGSSYAAALSATGGNTPYGWSLTAGALPGGLSLGTSSGVISGSPAAEGSGSFTVQVT